MKLGQDLVDCERRAFQSFQAAGGQFAAKWHLWLHLTDAIPRKGGVTAYSCWLDESGNRSLAEVCTAAAAGVFESGVLKHFAAAYTDTERPQARRAVRRRL